MSVGTLVLTCLRQSAGPSQEEGGWEYVDYHQGGEGKPEGHLESGVLYQPLGEGALGSGEVERSDVGARSFVSLDGSTVPVCKAGSVGPCARYVQGGQNCVGPHGHPENCSERGAKRTGHRPSKREAERALAEERKLGHNAACALVGAGVGAANVGAGIFAGWLCSEL